MVARSRARTRGQPRASPDDRHAGSDRERFFFIDKPNKPKPYAEVVTASAKTDSGMFIVHRVDEKLYFEIPDSLLGRDVLGERLVGGCPMLRHNI